MDTAFDRLLTEFGIRPTLVDVGASGAPPAIWDGIARHSIYIGFDPDLREMREMPGGRYSRTVIVNKAVADGGGAGEVPFYFTRSPFCSSTLRPDGVSLSNFAFSDLFAVEREAAVPAATLPSVLASLSLAGIDWLKADTQGTDLRIFNSLSPEVRSRILAVDVEPGLIDAYLGEDLFVDVHRDLVGQGFWLSRLDIRGSVRIRRRTVEDLAARGGDGIDFRSVERGVRVSPGWCEARYLRTIESLNRFRAPARDYVLLWIFSMLDGQTGYALDLSAEYGRLFGADGVSTALREEAILGIRRGKRRVSPLAGIRRSFGRLLRPAKKGSEPNP